MSEFQLSIIALGVAGVAGVFAYNKWQERRYRRDSDRAFHNEHPDVLLQAKTEPVLHETAAAAAGEARIEPVLTRAAEPPAQMRDAGYEPTGEPPSAPAIEETPPPEPEPPLVHPLVDCVMRLEAAEPVPTHQLWKAAEELLRGVNKPVRWLAWHDGRNIWQPVEAHGGLNTRQWRVALQLADRRGAITAAELEAFLRGLQQLSDRLMMVTELPDRAQLLARAQELDAFCAGVDVQIGLHVVASDPAGFAGSKLRDIVHATGLELDHDGRFHARDQAGHRLFTLGNLEPALFTEESLNGLSTHGVTLNLDVPCVMNGGAAFGTMLTTARQLAAGLGGAVVDDNVQPLSEQSLEMIRAKIVEFQDSMAKKGIPAGTTTALRLFS